MCVCVVCGVSLERGRKAVGILVYGWEVFLGGESSGGKGG